MPLFHTVSIIIILPPIIYYSSYNLKVPRLSLNSVIWVDWIHIICICFIQTIPVFIWLHWSIVCWDTALWANFVIVYKWIAFYQFLRIFVLIRIYGIFSHPNLDKIILFLLGLCQLKVLDSFQIVVVDVNIIFIYQKKNIKPIVLTNQPISITYYQLFQLMITKLKKRFDLSFF